MKKTLYIIIGVLVVLLGLVAYKYYKEAVKYKDLYGIEKDNVEAYANELNKTKEYYKNFKLTADELKNSDDSVNQKIVYILDSIKIKPKNVHTVEYSTAIIKKTDTIRIKGDTIFKDNELSLDTCIGDKWYELGLSLRYPSTIIASPTFNSEKYVIVNTKKEYVNKRSKIFFIRWFQKKKKVVTIDVVERNPYITNGEYRHIEILK